ncbi:hypothetical protein MNBD_PLANCTO03-2012 [hydrothermal vent metagenome]|uniref:Ribosome-binding factor A n=1 Tax=hydrothermal vent metagenome TaxID=652676 RepID=A0A3B1E6P2_9ZZZZ
MKSDDAKRRAAARSLCADLYDDDRPPPRRREGQRSESSNDRKTMQFCAQVRRVLQSHIPSHRCPEFIDLFIETVEPAPDASRLRVVISIPARSLHTPAAIHLQLAAMTGFLRSEIASAISRKRVPTLSFDLTPGKESL